MANRFDGKVVLVTGCGSDGGPGWGNGKAIAVLFGKEGAKVFGCDIRMDAAEETRDIIRKEGGECEVVKVDVADPGQIEAMVNTCMNIFGRIDVLVNNVGIAGEGGPVECTENRWRRDVDINLTSMFLTCKHVLPHMERQGSGSIVNISSLSGIRAMSIDSVSYQATKAAILGLSRSVALRYAAKKIRSNVVIPGLIYTPLFAQHATRSIEKQVPLGLGEAWDIAEAVLYLASEQAGYITGIELPVDGGLSAKFAIDVDAMIDATR